MNADRKRLDEISERVTGCACTVATGLGPGFREKVYENALAHALTQAGLLLSQQVAVKVEYDKVTVGAQAPSGSNRSAVLAKSIPADSNQLPWSSRLFPDRP